MRLAILDLGTNTFHLLIAETDANHKVKFLFSEQQFVKIGKDGIHKGIIQSEALYRAAQAIEYYSRLIKKHHVSSTFAIATAAIRSASNGNEILIMVKEKTGAEVKTISGHREAELIWNGVRHAIAIAQKTVLIMDIGGGSVEFIIGNGEKILWKESFPIGGAMMTEKFKISDRITAGEIKMLENYWEENLPALFAAAGKLLPKKLIGSSGSFESFADIILHTKAKSLKDFTEETSYEFEEGDFQKLLSTLISSGLKERLNLPGLMSGRADMIVPAILLVSFIRKKLGITNMFLSKYALKEGIAFELLQSGK